MFLRGKNTLFHSTTSTPAFLCVWASRETTSDGGFLPRPPPTQKFPNSCQSSVIRKEQFPERGQHISDVGQRQHFSCAPSTSTVTSHPGHTPISTVTSRNAPRSEQGPCKVWWRLRWSPPLLLVSGWEWQTSIRHP